MGATDSKQPQDESPVELKDRQYLYMGGMLGPMRVRDARKDFAVVPNKVFDKAVSALAMSRNGRHLYASVIGEGIYVLRVDSHGPIQKELLIPSRRNEAVNCLVTAPKTGLVYAASDRLQCFDPQRNFKCIRKRKLPFEQAWNLRFLHITKDNKWLFASFKNNGIVIYNPRNLKSTDTIHGPMEAMCVGPDSSVFVAPKNADIMTYRVSNSGIAEQQHSLSFGPRRLTDTERVKYMCCSPNGALLASTSEGRIFIWSSTQPDSVPSAILIHSHDDSSTGRCEVGRLFFSADGQYMLSGSQTFPSGHEGLCVWDVASGYTRVQTFSATRQGKLGWNYAM